MEASVTRSSSAAWRRNGRQFGRPLRNASGQTRGRRISFRPAEWVRIERPGSRRVLVALVVLLRGVNVGGHRTFRPTTLTKQLKHLDAVNIGAAGTFVIRQPVTRAQLRAELASKLPFSTEVMICQGREILSLMSHKHFADQPMRPDIVRFV